MLWLINNCDAFGLLAQILGQNELIVHEALATLHYFKPAASVSRLSPVHYRRRTPRPVSYYALFKWWLLLSQHPGCHRIPTSFRTEHDSGTLAGDLGCSPLDYEAYPSQSECWNNGIRGIRSLIGFDILVGTLSHPVLYLLGVLFQR